MSNIESDTEMLLRRRLRQLAAHRTSPTASPVDGQQDNRQNTATSRASTDEGPLNPHPVPLPSRDARAQPQRRLALAVALSTAAAALVSAVILSGGWSDEPVRSTVDQPEPITAPTGASTTTENVKRSVVAAEVAGRSFLILMMAGADNLPQVPADGAHLAFLADGTFEATAGCNTFRGTYATEARAPLTVTSLTTTDAVCNGTVVVHEQILHAALLGGTLAWSNGDLVLSSVAGQVFLRDNNALVDPTATTVAGSIDSVQPSRPDVTTLSPPTTNIGQSDAWRGQHDQLLAERQAVRDAFGTMYDDAAYVNPPDVYLSDPVDITGPGTYPIRFVMPAGTTLRGWSIQQPPDLVAIVMVEPVSPVANPDGYLEATIRIDEIPDQPADLNYPGLTVWLT